MSRELVWIEQQHFRGFRCSVCGWRFRPSGALTGTSFDEMMRNFELQREKEFTSHVFVPITPKGLGSTSPSTYCAGRLSGLRNQGLFRRSLSLVAWATPVTSTN
jgi:uncharacterized OB-fold protein